ncbi:MAG TPA: hypothetical protein PLW81_00485 [Thiobacillaceae bacterium]|nr:hypothetical protein [Thiobacillaceae bacterium]
MRFLRTYGPTPNNLSLFDEYVSAALAKAKVSPIRLHSPQLPKIIERVRSGISGSILIAGTAGDGKTYHCRSLWTELGGDGCDWAGPDLIKRLSLEDGRVATFVKDLSELGDDQGDEVLELLERSVLGEEDREFLVLAANHGQILERLRSLGLRQGRSHPLRKPVQDAFLQTGPGHDRLAVFDLSKTAHRHSLEESLDAVARHPAWSNCAGCSLDLDGRVCPIAENRRRLLGEGDGRLLAKRLGDLVEIARHNGAHLPVRDLLALAANMILGHPAAREGLMACADVAKLQQAVDIERGSVYSNVFGANLPRRRTLSRPVFRALTALGIGEETSNAADGLLVYGADDSRLLEPFQRLVASDSIYGSTPTYRASQERYLEGEEGARLDEGATDFLKRLEAQRQRLFFTLPDGEAAFHYWELTAFRFAGEYLETITALTDRRAISEAVRARLARGINRVMSGLLLENTDKVFVASSGGFTHSKISVLCDTELPARRAPGGLGMALKLDEITGQPRIDIAIAHGANGIVSLVLTPIRFEFLCRVAEGYLPGSFSNECLEDLMAFKARLLRQAELSRMAIVEEEEPLPDDGTLTLNFIEIEHNGHGFSKPIAVRVAQ